MDAMERLNMWVDLNVPVGCMCVCLCVCIIKITAVEEGR